VGDPSSLTTLKLVDSPLGPAALDYSLAAWSTWDSDHAHQHASSRQL